MSLLDPQKIKSKRASWEVPDVREEPGPHGLAWGSSPLGDNLFKCLRTTQSHPGILQRTFGRKDVS